MSVLPVSDFEPVPQTGNFFVVLPSYVRDFSYPLSVLCNTAFPLSLLLNVKPVNYLISPTWLIYSSFSRFSLPF